MGFWVFLDVWGPPKYRPEIFIGKIIGGGIINCNYCKVVALVTDNAANMSATARLGGWKHLPCFAHSLNLIVQTGLKKVQDTHIKVKAIVEFFKRSPQAAAKLRAVETQLGCQQLNVKQDMPVRWNSTKDMFERILQIKEPLISTLALVNYEKNTLTLSDWQIIAYSLKALKVFQEVTAPKKM
jgi:hypothetical protein